VEKGITQTKQRVLGENCHVEGKVLSLFEPHTQVIRRGKAHKPNEFGRLVRIDEVENGIVSGYQVLEGNPADTTAWMPALQQHQACFGRAPENGHRRPKIFFRPERARSAKAKCEESGAAGARTSIGQARQAAEAALVPARAALACRL